MTVNGETAFLILRARSYMLSVISELERCSTDIYAASTAAFDLAMAAELTLKYVLLTNGIEPSKTHNHAQLIKECGMNEITVPKELRIMTIDLRTWEGTTRYDSGAVIDKADVERGYAVVKRYMDKLYEDFIANAYAVLKTKLSSEKLDNKAQEELVIQYLNYL